MTIPFYTDEYATPDGADEDGVIYKIQDKLEANSFAGIKNLSVKINESVMVDDDDNPETPDVLQETEVTPTSLVDDDDDPTTEPVEVTNFTVVYRNAAGTAITQNIDTEAVAYEITFSDAWLRANATKNVAVTYDTVLTTEAHVNGTANKTAATLTYTVDPSDNTIVKVLRDSTYHYTFEIGGQIDASADGTDGMVDGGASFLGYEINKVTQALGQGETYAADANGVYASDHTLGGATFTLYDDAAFTTIHQLKRINGETGEWENYDATCTTGANGHLVFSGLDVGTYYLKETAAPEHYTLNGNDYKVEITGTIEDGTGDAEVGTLTGYSITISQKVDNAWEVVGTSLYEIVPTVIQPANLTLDTVTNEITTTIVPAEIVDTRIAELPATGGIGTIIITVCSAIGMTVFLTVYLVNRKKKKEKEDE